MPGRAKSGDARRGTSRGAKPAGQRARAAASGSLSTELLLAQGTSAAARTSRRSSVGARAEAGAKTSAKASVKAAKKSPGARTTAGARGAGRKRSDEGRLLDEAELSAIESQHPEGMTLSQVIDAFARRGAHLSEASFRKYVQLGLLGRSRRVGRKGRHQGSLGMYPATTVRRICAIKRMMAARYTIEDIQRSFLRFTEEVEGLQRALERLFAGFERELQAGEFPSERRRTLARELQAAQKLGTELAQRVESLERQLVSPLQRAARARGVGVGARGGIDDLL